MSVLEIGSGICSASLVMGELRIMGMPTKTEGFDYYGTGLSRSSGTGSGVCLEPGVDLVSWVAFSMPSLRTSSNDTRNNSKSHKSTCTINPGVA